jgi:hypothetical protein
MEGLVAQNRGFGESAVFSLGLAAKSEPRQKPQIFATGAKFCATKAGPKTIPTTNQINLKGKNAII